MRYVQLRLMPISEQYFSMHIREKLERAVPFRVWRRENPQVTHILLSHGRLLHYGTEAACFERLRVAIAG
ncbi:MAG: hypothetical protein ABFD89_29415 [Bryobacteraceae bacterium]